MTYADIRKWANNVPMKPPAAELADASTIDGSEVSLADVELALAEDEVEVEATAEPSASACKEVEVPKPAEKRLREKTCSKCFVAAAAYGSSCKACNKVGVKINRAFGSMPEEFKKLTKEDKAQFWLDAADLSQNDLAKHVEEYIEKISEEKDKMAGDFLPLSVWAAKGFDAKLIEENSTEATREWNPTLGVVCYKTKLHKTSEAEIKKRCSRAKVGNFAAREIARQHSSPRRDSKKDSRGEDSGDQGAAALPSNPGGQTHSPKPKDDPDKKKQKKGPTNDAVRKLAGLQLSKCSPALISVHGDLNDELANSVHPTIRKKAADAEKQLQGFRESAEKAMRDTNPSKFVTETCSKDILQKLKEPLEACALMASMLAALRQSKARSSNE